MSRAKEFDEAEVLGKALDLFRARGYMHTSFEDLTGELGVSRQSLYDTYGDKHALFHSALKRYLEQGLDHIRRKLDDPAPVRGVLGGMLDALITGQCSNGSPGCMMVNAMVELAPHDPDTRALAHAHARQIEGLLASRLAAAQRAGDLDKNKDPVALAGFFYHTILGLSVATRALGDRDSLRKSAQTALSVLG